MSPNVTAEAWKQVKLACEERTVVALDCSGLALARLPCIECEALKNATSWPWLLSDSHLLGSAEELQLQLKGW